MEYHGVGHHGTVYHGVMVQCTMVLLWLTMVGPYTMEYYSFTIVYYGVLEIDIH